MGFFDETDPFEGIFDEFFGRSKPRSGKKRETFIRGEEEDRVSDFIESDDYVYLIFELPGFSEKEVTVSIDKNELIIRAQKKNDENVQTYLTQKLKQGISISKTLPQFVSSKKISHTMHNGILEIILGKK